MKQKSGLKLRKCRLLKTVFLGLVNIEPFRKEWLFYANQIRWLSTVAHGFGRLKTKTEKSAGLLANFGATDMNPAEVGSGVVDFKRIFDNAKESGMKYFFVEQDQAAQPL